MPGAGGRGQSRLHRADAGHRGGRAAAGRRVEVPPAFPVVTALAGRPAPPKAPRRSAVPVLTCILTTARFSNPLTYAGPNLATSQLIIYEPHGEGSFYSGLGPPLTAAQQRALGARVTALAASIHARFVLPLDSAGRPSPAPDTLTFSDELAGAEMGASCMGA